MKSPLINPIRFYNPANEPDYLTKFPNIDNIYNGKDWVYGVSSFKNYSRIHTDVLYLQFLLSTGNSPNFKLYQLLDGEWVIADTIVAVDISPASWISDPIYLLTVDQPDGVYYLDAPNLLRSDIFTITTEARILKDCVKIDYANSENDFGCIFDNGVTTYEFTAYFIGQLLTGTPGVEIESYEDDRGEPVKLRSTPQRTAILNLKGIHYTYSDYFTHLFSCDTVTINGVEYENTEAPSFDLTQSSDLGSLSIKLIQKTNDYYNG